MKIALVFPRCKYPSGDPPLGMAYLASILLKNTDADVDLIDMTFQKSPIKYAESIFEKKNYDIVGFSLMTTMFKDALKIASLIKKYSKDTKVIFGGPHPTVFPEETLNYNDIDAVCVGEGELTFLDLIKNNGNFQNVKGLWFKHNHKIIKNPPNLLVGNLDDMPFPSFDLLPMEKYFKNWFQLDSVSDGLKGVGILASRGCPYNCSYCQPTLRKIFGQKIRKRSHENIIKELKIIKEKYNINAFIFLDDTFIIDNKWVTGICDLMIKNKLNLVWGCNARADLVTKDLFLKMKEAGLRKVFLGIESGSQRVLDKIYNKQITLKQVESSVKILKSLDLKVQGYFMIGAPTETREEIIKTIKLAKNLDLDEATFSITTPLPCTHLYNKTKDLIKMDVGDFDYYKRSVYKKMVLTPGEIERLKKRAFIEFYLSPKRLIKTIKTTLSIKKTINKLKRF